MKIEKLRIKKPDKELITGLFVDSANFCVSGDQVLITEHKDGMKKLAEKLKDAKIIEDIGDRLYEYSELSENAKPKARQELQEFLEEYYNDSIDEFVENEIDQAVEDINKTLKYIELDYDDVLYSIGGRDDHVGIYGTNLEKSIDLSKLSEDAGITDGEIYGVTGFTHKFGVYYHEWPGAPGVREGDIGFEFSHDSDDDKAIKKAQNLLYGDLQKLIDKFRELYNKLHDIYYKPITDADVDEYIRDSRPLFYKDGTLVYTVYTEDE